jgi:hypothetical protein
MTLTFPYLCNAFICEETGSSIRQKWET